MRVPILFLAIVLCHSAAADGTTPAWLVALRPDLVMLGHDAEIASLCQHYRRHEDGAAVLNSLDSLGERELQGLDASFAENAILEGRAAALLSIQQTGLQGCPKRRPDRLIIIQRQSRTPIRKWPQVKS